MKIKAKWLTAIRGYHKHLAEDYAEYKVKKLIQAGVDVSLKIPKYGFLGHLIIENGDKDNLDLLFQCSLVNLELQCKKGKTLLNKAISHSNWDITIDLIERGAKLDAPDYFGRTPLYLLCRAVYDERIEKEVAGEIFKMLNPSELLVEMFKIDGHKSTFYGQSVQITYVTDITQPSIKQSQLESQSFSKSSSGSNVSFKDVPTIICKDDSVPAERYERVYGRLVKQEDGITRNLEIIQWLVEDLKLKIHAENLYKAIEFGCLYLVSCFLSNLKQQKEAIDKFKAIDLVIKHSYNSQHDDIKSLVPEVILKILKYHNPSGALKDHIGDIITNEQFNIADIADISARSKLKDVQNQFAWAQICEWLDRNNVRPNVLNHSEGQDIAVQNLGVGLVGEEVDGEGV